MNTNNFIIQCDTKMVFHDTKMVFHDKHIIMYWLLLLKLYTSTRWPRFIMSFHDTWYELSPWQHPETCQYD